MNDLAKLAVLASAAYAGSKLINKDAEGAPSTNIPIASGGGGDTGGYAISGDTAAMVAYVLGTLHGDAVWLQQGAVGGTAEPAGCRQFPCATLAEARTVCTARGINKIHMVGAFTLDADMSGYIFISDSGLAGAAGATLTLTALTSVTGSVFINMNLAGTAHLATVDTIYMINGQCYVITNPIILIGYNISFVAGGFPTFLDTGSRIYNATGGVDANHIFINVNGIVTFHDFHGVIEIGGMNAAGDTVHIDGSGQVNESAAPACTAGTMTVYGDMRIVAIGGGVTIVDRTNWSILVSLLASSARTRCAHMAQWSAVVEEIVIQDGAGDVALPQIVISKIPAGAIVTHAHVYFKYGAKENTFAGVNKLSGAQEIQINRGGAGWVDCINLVDDYFTTAASTREGGGIVIGNLDMAATVTGNATYTFQWDEALCDADFLFFNDIQIGLYIEYSI